ncbi:MAG: hypothetical protein DMG23_05320 [Acidobacteria bacterium]|nr:MAG: hypothetical protein DMG23_05320 [Acidobacteriota bacterium]
MMLFSRPSTYAIRALTYLAMQPPGKLSGTREISEREDIPNFFLGKVLLQLRRGRLLRSYKGTGGGYQLALPPDKINLLMIVRCIAGDELFDTCILEDHECGSYRQCALHESWVAIRDELRAVLERNTLAELVRARSAEGVKSPATDSRPAEQ